MLSNQKHIFTYMGKCTQCYLPYSTQLTQRPQIIAPLHLFCKMMEGASQWTLFSGLLNLPWKSKYFLTLTCGTIRQGVTKKTNEGKAFKLWAAMDCCHDRCPDHCNERLPIHLLAIVPELATRKCSYSDKYVYRSKRKTFETLIPNVFQQRAQQMVQNEDSFSKESIVFLPHAIQHP